MNIFKCIKILAIICILFFSLFIVTVLGSHGAPPVSTIKDITDTPKKDESFLPDLFTGSITFSRGHYEEDILPDHREQWDKWMFHRDEYKYEVLGYPKIYVTQPLEEDSYLRIRMDSTNGGRVLIRPFKYGGNDKIYFKGITFDEQGKRMYNYGEDDYTNGMWIAPGSTYEDTMRFIPKDCLLEIIVMPDVYVNWGESIYGKVTVENNPTKIGIDIDIQKVESSGTNTKDGTKPDTNTGGTISDTTINLPTTTEDSILNTTQTTDTTTGDTDLKLDIPTVDPPVEVDPEIYMPITQDELNRRKELLDEYDKLYNNNKIKIDELAEDVKILKDLFYKKGATWLISNTGILTTKVPTGGVEVGFEIIKSIVDSEEVKKINDENLKYKKITDELVKARKIKEDEIIRLINENEAIKNAKIRELEELNNYKIVKPGSTGFGEGGDSK